MTTPEAIIGCSASMLVLGWQFPDWLAILTSPGTNFEQSIAMMCHAAHKNIRSRSMLGITRVDTITK